jgi:hypothetical protein
VVILIPVCIHIYITYPKLINANYNDGEKGDNMTLGDNMMLVAMECTTTTTRMVAAIPSDPTAVPFVAKIQKARTRKNKNYFVLRKKLERKKEIICFSKQRKQNGIICWTGTK